MTTSKTYVLDTTVLIEDPDVMYKLGNSLIVIPMAVIKELDGLKRSDVGSVAQAARAVARTLDRLGSYGDLREGVKLSSGGVLKVYNGSETVDGLASEADNRIVGAAVRLQREVSNVTLLTTDGNMRTVARVSGVKAEIMGVSYERTVKKEIEMDKYRMEVERVEERGRSFKQFFKNEYIQLSLIVIIAISLIVLGFSGYPIAMLILLVGAAAMGIIMFIDRKFHPEEYPETGNYYWDRPKGYFNKAVEDPNYSSVSCNVYYDKKD